MDELLAADFNGVLRWAVQQGSELAYGPYIGPVFADAVNLWDRLAYSPGTYYDNPEWWA